MWFGVTLSDDVVIDGIYDPCRWTGALSDSWKARVRGKPAEEEEAVLLLLRRGKRARDMRTSRAGGLLVFQFSVHRGTMCHIRRKQLYRELR